jgi:hypothetical protein
MKKYELTEETFTVFGKTLYRIRAVRDFGSVKTGEFGGYIEKEENLSHFGDAWVYGNAKVSGNAWVYGDAWVYGNAKVFNTRHFFVQGPIGSRDGYVTFYRTKDDTVEVRCGCFSGSLQEFVNQVEETHGGSRYEKEYKLAAELAKVCIRLEGESR